MEGRVSGRPLLSRAVGVHRNFFWPGSSVFPLCHRLVPAVPAGHRSRAVAFANATRSGTRGSGHRVSCDPLLSAHARQRRQPDQGRPVHLQWPHPDPHCDWQVHHRRAGHRLGTFARSRRSVAANRRMPCLSLGQKDAAVTRSDAADRSRGCGRRTGSGVQRSDFSRAIRDRGSNRALERRHPRISRTFGGLKRGRDALVPRLGISVPYPCRRVETTVGTPGLCRSWRCWRSGLGRVCQRDCYDSSLGQSAAEVDAVFSACDRGIDDRRDRNPRCATSDGRGIRIHRSGNARPIHVAVSGDSGRAEDRGDASLFYQRNARRNVRSNPVHRRHAGSGGGRSATRISAALDGISGNLRAGRHGSSVRGISCACR